MLAVRRPTPPRCVIAVQHDGVTESLFEHEYEARTESTKKDLGVMPIAMEIFRKADPRAAVVWNQIPRRFLDTNRDPEDRLVWKRPFRDSRLAQEFERFHAAIDGLIEESVAAYGHMPVLIDLHGFADQPRYASKPHGYDAILGTGNGTTIRRGDFDRKIANRLEQAGFCVFCPGTETAIPDGTPDCYNGGYLVRRAAKSNHGLDAAIQIEIAPYLRKRMPEETSDNEKRVVFVDAIARTIADA